jgi:hypothetical protein
MNFLMGTYLTSFALGETSRFVSIIIDIASFHSALILEEA